MILFIFTSTVAVLASDLIEPLRARVDVWVWRLFAERALKSEMFTMRDGACLLSKKGRQIFYQRFEVFVRPLRRLLRRYGLVVARALLEDAR
jgi:CRISPR-associated protein Cas1